MIAVFTWTPPPPPSPFLPCPAERADFAATLAQSLLPGAEPVAGRQSQDWNHALRWLAPAVPEDSPGIAVMDEVPWLVEQDQEFEGVLQTVWDRRQ